MKQVNENPSRLTVPRFVLSLLIVALCSSNTTNLRAQENRGDSNSEVAPPIPSGFLTQHCIECHSSDNPESTLDLESLISDGLTERQLQRWILIHDRIVNGEMPPPEAKQPTKAERKKATGAFKDRILSVERRATHNRPQLRRLTRTEYENTIRDVFHLPGIALAESLPADGKAHGFDKTFDALDISHVNIAKYLETADHILDIAIATRPEPPTIQKRRISLVNRGGFVAHIVMNGDGVLLKNGLPDPDFPPAAEQNHLNQGAHERWGSFRNGASVGLFRHEDESVSPYFIEHVTIYPGQYRVRTSLWSFQWDCGQMLPGRGTEAARLSVVKLTGDGRGGQHPSYVLGYFDAPSERPMEHELQVWLNHNELIGFNTASLAPAANYYKQKRAMEFKGPGIVVDWLDIEGPLHDTWPPKSHQLLFGQLPITEFKPDPSSAVRPPLRQRPRQLGAGMNRPDHEPGVWTVQSENPVADAASLLDQCLPKLFRKPVTKEIRDQYLEVVKRQLKSGDCFETAMRHAYRNALISPDFLFHLSDEAVRSNSGPATTAPATTSENAPIQDDALACRLSYFLWNSCPDAKLLAKSQDGSLRETRVLLKETERLLNDQRSKRFIDHFLGQWLRLEEIAATDPDKKLYPEFSPYLQDCMLAETRKFFTELIQNNLSVTNLVDSDFLLLNQKLAQHYGINDIEGTSFRRVRITDECPRGGFLTQASILKITANGTTTSPVPRGAFVMDRLLGKPPQPPPENISAIEPDVRGTTTVREQLEKYRSDMICASCHQTIDPPGFALESFDVIGGFRTHYRSIGEGMPADRGDIDPMIGISFLQGKEVDSHSTLHDGSQIRGIDDYRAVVVGNIEGLTRNLAKQLLTYATGRPPRFEERETVDKIVSETINHGGSVRTLIREIVKSPIFLGQPIQHQDGDDQELSPAILSANTAADQSESPPQLAEKANHFLMVERLPEIKSPAQRATQPNPATDELETSKPLSFPSENQIEVVVNGLFIAEQTDRLRTMVQEIEDLRILNLDPTTAQVTFQYSIDKNRFRSDSPQQVIDQLNQILRQQSSGIFSAKAMVPEPATKIQQATFPILGLDCKACSLAVHDILISIDGVIHAKADFQRETATAWYDSDQCSDTAIAEKLQQQGVTLHRVITETE